MQPFPQYNKGNIIATLGFTLLTAFSVPAIANDSTDAKLQQAIAGDHRSEKNSARDQYRKPLETLSWLGIKDNMTVVEITPGGGWYTEILAPYLKDNGTYYAAGFDSESKTRYYRKAAKAFKEKLAANPAVYGNVKVTELAPPSKTNIAPASSADMVLTFRNVHNWMSADNSDAILAAMYSALKPGGTLGLVEHRGNPEVKQNLKAKSGYVNEAYTIAMVEKAGFKLVGKSELLANSKDNRNHPQGVWTLPPRLKLGSVNKAKYLSIGESDRMLLKFVK